MTETDSPRITELRQHEEWIRRKSAATLRFERSRALLSEEFAAKGFDPLQGGWLAAEDYTLAGGSFPVPVRVRGTGVVAAVTASGLSSDDDHKLVVDSIRTYLKDPAE